MQAVALDPIVGLLDAGIGIVDCPHANLMATCKAQPETDSVFELERRTQFVAFKLSAGKCSHADARLDVGLH
ncbi:hypothetical protein D3C73_1419360 [compost metagenome]